MEQSSAAEIGTSLASMNRTLKTNAAKGVSNHYNEYKDFHRCEVEAHVCASVMEMSAMKTFDGKTICFVTIHETKGRDCNFQSTEIIILIQSTLF